MTDRDKLILQAAGAGPVSAGEIAASTGYSITTVGMALGAHGWTRRFLTEFGRRKMWFAPEPADELLSTPSEPDHFRIRPTRRPAPAPLGRRVLVIPDTQVKPGVPLEHMTWAGRYIASKRPDAIVHLGDHWDMPSLSTYDKGKRCFEGRRYDADIKAGNEAMDLLTREYRNLPGYAPEEHFLMGNHEQRIERATELQAELEGVISHKDLNLTGWVAHPFLSVLNLDGIKFSHYFTTGVMGRPVSSAAVLLRTAAGSAVMGHVQKCDMAIHEKTGAISLMAGVYYQHDEDYLGPQGNACRRQLVMLNECRAGVFDPMFVSLDYLRHRYS